jgi:hypothetical protein
LPNASYARNPKSLRRTFPTRFRTGRRFPRGWTRCFR